MKRAQTSRPKVTVAAPAENEAARAAFSRLIVIVCLAAALPGCGDAPRSLEGRQTARRLRIAAASDLKFALADVVVAFEKQHPDVQLKMTYGSSGTFFSQLSYEAPFDLFLSADMTYPQKLIEQGHAVAGSDFEYAIGHIVIWAAKDWPIDVEQGFEILRDDAVLKIAVANPQTAPYGRAAIAALKSVGIYDAVESKLVYGESIAQTVQMAESGAADVGIVALSLALSPALQDKGRYYQIPDDAHPPIVQGGVVLRWAEDAALAGEFRDFLLSADAAAILKRFGFVPAGE